MENLIRDLRYSFRTLLRKPAFTIVAVLSLALGIGANTTIFSLVNELFLRPLPVDEPEDLVAIYTVDAKISGNRPISHLNWKDFREQNDTFESIVGYHWTPMSVATGSEPAVVFGQLVSGNYFDTLGVRPMIGRAFLPEEDQTLSSHPVVVLSHDFWAQRLGSDSGILDKTITINGQPFSVIGVAPPEFTGTDVGLQPELWVPMMMYPVAASSFNTWYEQRRGLFLAAIGRLKPGMSLEQAKANLTVIAERLEREYPDDNQGRSVNMLTLAEATVQPASAAGLVAISLVLMAVVGLVLLIACANVANLLLARATERRQEIAVRLSLGASRKRLISQLLTESVTVSVLGGIVGLGIAFWGRSLLLGFVPSLPIPINVNLDLSLDVRVLFFTLLLSVLTGLLFGLAPAIQSSRPGLVAAIKDQGGLALGDHRKLTVRNALVVAQIALSLVALIGAGLFLRSLAAAQKIDPGFEAENLLAISFNVSYQGYSQAQGEQFFRDAVERARALPGVVEAAVAQGGPFQGTLFRSVLLEGQGEQDRTFVQVNAVGDQYFETMGIPIEEGRPFVEEDREGSVPAVIVNRTLADKFWPDQNPLGRRFSFFGEDSPMEVVGVARDVKYNNLTEKAQPYAYVPLAQHYLPGVTLIARTERSPGAVLRNVEQEIRAMNPDLPLAGTRTIADLIYNALALPRLAASLLGFFGLLALALAAVGVYGVMSYAVNNRRREIGIRMALGAKQSSVLALVLRQGMTLVLIGLIVGLVLAFFMSKAAARILLVSPTDPIAIITTILVLALAAVIANFFPARRATGVDPIHVLRYE